MKKIVSLQHAVQCFKDLFSLHMYIYHKMINNSNCICLKNKNSIIQCTHKRKNNSEYCGKILRFNSGKKFSMHYHLEKKETWYIS